MSSKIALIPYAIDRSLTGIGRYTRELLCALYSEGLALTLLQPGSWDRHPYSVGLPGVSLLPALLTLGQIEIAWTTWHRRLDLVHDPSGVIPITLAHTKRVATVYDVIPYIYPGTCTALDWLIYRLWLPFAIHRLDMLVTVSQQSRTDIVHFLPIDEEKVMVIPGAANKHYRRMGEEAIRPALRRAGINFPYILYVGSIEPRKNLLRLLEAYTLFRQWSTKWGLVIVGARNIWKSTPLAAALERLELKGCVHFTGYISEEDLPAIYNGADLFVFPSLYEGFGLPVLESMACGTPVVTSNSSSLPEVAGEAAILIDPYDVEAIAGAMQCVLADPILGEELAIKGIQRAGEFSWERTARETIAVYEEILGEGIL